MQSKNDKKKEQVVSSEVTTYTDEEPKFIPVVEESDPVYYTKHNWKADVYTHKCENCGMFINAEDDMIIHVITHVPENERTQLLEQLLKQKENK